jgi:hypothetical protein
MSAQMIIMHLTDYDIDKDVQSSHCTVAAPEKEFGSTAFLAAKDWKENSFFGRDNTVSGKGFLSRTTVLVLVLVLGS